MAGSPEPPLQQGPPHLSANSPATRHHGLRRRNPHRSITLYFQKDSPGKDKEANWLRSPADDFIPMLRMNWPKDTAPSILNGSWAPPMVKRVP